MDEWKRSVRRARNHGQEDELDRHGALLPRVILDQLKDLLQVEPRDPPKREPTTLGKLGERLVGRGAIDAKEPQVFGNDAVPA